MFKRIVLWLVIKFLTPRDRLQLVVDDGFLNSPRHTIDNLYHVAHSNRKGKAFESFDRLAAKRLSEIDVSGSMFIVTLFALRAKLITCPDPNCAGDEYRNFFREVNIIKEHNNRLKVSKDLIELVRKETLFDNDKDITLMAHVLQHNDIDPDTVTAFFTDGESK